MAEPVVKPRTKLGVLISGNGSNLQAIIDRVAAGKLNAEVAVVLSDQAEAYGLRRARERDIPALFIDPGAYASTSDFNNAILDALRQYQVELVVLAGYMRLVGREILAAYPLKVINLHPALLPAFPGAHAIEDALAYGVRVSGVTVHFADENFDTGPIILQDFVPVHQNDTVADLRRRIQKVEHELLPRAIYLLVEGRVKVAGRRVRILGARSKEIAK